MPGQEGDRRQGLDLAIDAEPRGGYAIAKSISLRYALEAHNPLVGTMKWHGFRRG